ncbi:hypothetical protein D6T64_18450 [Cryobacterium melibiosiphilum]|uniref:Uncharacterized protein n=2 Tax=Cryobacterium melibiosiphilum TaxID=995039 RepID=A0A3A5MLK0_9MICO|nr:hypothetical protein D6T64_18450 [Cryobacterium melibiosiphilum]
MRELGRVPVSAGARGATQALTRALEDPAVRDGSAPERRRWFAGFSRRHRLVVGSLVALVGIGVGVPAVATSMLARTGEFGDPATSTEVDDTEWLDPGADDLPQVIIDAYPDYLTLPPGMPENLAIADTSRLMGAMGAEHAVGQAVVQESYVTQVYETFAICAWTDAWLGAHASADSDAEALATAWIGDFDNYRAFSRSESVRDRMAVIATAAGNGNPGIVTGAYTENDCAVRLGDNQ